MGRGTSCFTPGTQGAGRTWRWPGVHEEPFEKHLLVAVTGFYNSHYIWSLEFAVIGALIFHASWVLLNRSYLANSVATVIPTLCSSV